MSQSVPASILSATIRHYRINVKQDIAQKMTSNGKDKYGAELKMAGRKRISL
jgi:hypothetical protein